MDVKTGEIISLVSLPNFDIAINIRADLQDKKYINKITKGVYELRIYFQNFYNCTCFRL